MNNIAKNFLIIILLIAIIAAGIWLTASFISWRTTEITDPVNEDPTTELPPSDDEQYQRAVPLGQIPILMYHVIGEGSGSLQELYVSPDTFASQMEYLHSNGYHTITMGELYAHWQEGAPLPPRPIILTFDDGYRSDYELAFPILQSYGFRAVHFLFVKKLGLTNGLTQAEIAELLAAGHEVGNHTYNHVELHTATQQGLVKETKQAKAALEEMLDIHVTYFCYPVGRYNTEAVQAVEESGHKLAVTTEYGYASPEQGLLTLKRIRINRSDGLKGFIQKLKQYEEIEPTDGSKGLNGV